jgi:nucleotide-binding universal stress UspA family protein
MKVLAAITDDCAAPAVLASAAAVADVACAETEALHVGHENTLLAQAAQEVGVTLRTVGGRAVEAIVDACAAEDVVAIVIGARGSPVGTHPVGATTTALITLLNKPVVVVPRDAHVEHRIERVLVPLDGTTQGATALQQAMQLMSSAQLEVVVAHVYDQRSLPAFSDHLPHEVRAWREEFIARHCPAALDARLELRVGEAREQLLDILRRSGCELVALSWSQDLTDGRAVVVRRMLAESPVPVLLAPEHREPHTLVAPSPAAHANQAT